MLQDNFKGSAVSNSTTHNYPYSVGDDANDCIGSVRIVVDFEVVVSIRSHHRYLGSLGIEEKKDSMHFL